MTDDNNDPQTTVPCGAGQFRKSSRARIGSSPNFSDTMRLLAISMTNRAMTALVRLVLTLAIASAAAQEITLEEVKVEAAFVSPLELPLSKSIDQLIERLRLRDENARALELHEANKSTLTNLLDLTRYEPIPLGGSESRVDAFMQENYMRADLNPREKDSLFAREKH